jgi:hypothetical protein
MERFKLTIMRQNFFFILFIVVLSCSSKTQNGQMQEAIAKPQSDTSFIWTKLLDSGPWKKSYNFQMLTIKDKLWVFHSEGSWSSSAGINWSKSPLSNPIKNLAFLKYVYFKNAVLGLGQFTGNSENYTFKPEIYQTTDFKNWKTISKNSNLPIRYFYYPFVFDNKIWIIGGEDKNTKYADIWNSPDGITWTKQKDNLPFGKRSNSKIIELNGTLYLLNNDVWTSKDGLNWTLLTKEIFEGEELFGYSVAIMDNKIWLLGCNRNGKFESQVFVSADGKNWQGQNAPWTPRGGIASTVFNNKIYMTGGKYGGLVENGTTTEFIYSNDVWSFGKK